MKAVIHMGLHKTGSTYIQYFAALNAKGLLSRGVYFGSILGYPAHHSLAGDVLTGDFSSVERATITARRLGAHTLLISSEDLESLLFKPALAARLVDNLRDHDVTETAFVFYLRRPDETFWSAYAECSRHAYVNSRIMFERVMASGHFVLNRPRGGDGQSVPAAWHFSFDHERHVSRFRRHFADDASVEVRFYDFNAFKDYPGDEMFDHMGVADILTSTPPEWAKNKRLDDDIVLENQVKILKAHLAPISGTCIRNFIREKRAVDPKERQAMSQALNARFRPGLERLFEREPAVLRYG